MRNSISAFNGFSVHHIVESSMCVCVSNMLSLCLRNFVTLKEFQWNTQKWRLNANTFRLSSVELKCSVLCDTAILVHSKSHNKSSCLCSVTWVFEWKQCQCCYAIEPIEWTLTLFGGSSVHCVCVCVWLKSWFTVIGEKNRFSPKLFQTKLLLVSCEKMSGFYLCEFNLFYLLH